MPIRSSQLAFYVNLHRTVIGPSATLTGRWRPDIDLRRMLTGFMYDSATNGHSLFKGGLQHMPSRSPWVALKRMPIRSLYVAFQQMINRSLCVADSHLILMCNFTSLHPVLTCRSASFVFILSLCVALHHWCSSYRSVSLCVTGVNLIFICGTASLVHILSLLVVILSLGVSLHHFSLSLRIALHH